MKYLLLFFAGILAASCVRDADSSFMPVDEPRAVIFTVALDNHRTKADWEDAYESENGLPFDSRIIPEMLRVVVLSKNGTRIGTIRNLDYWPIDETHTQFQFIGQMPEEFAGHFNENTDGPDYRFMVLANCGDNSSGEEYITYSQTQLDPSSKDSSIPMWGVKEVNMTPLMNAESMDIGDIWLLRAAAKIEVKLSDALKNEGSTSIEGATLKYYNQTGYCLPGGWSQATDTRKLDQENCIRLYRHAAVNLPFVQDDKTGDYYVYVTEYDNRNYPGEQNKISLEFNINGEQKLFEDAISFCNYRNGKPEDNSYYDIVRNHIYEFEILSIAGDNLVLEYQVADWVTEDWGNDMEYEEHDLSYPTYHNPVVPAEYLTLAMEDINDYKISTEPKMFYNANELEAGAFECYFQITSPADVQWKPAITGTKENYRIRVYNHTSGPDTGKLLFDSSNPDLQDNLSSCPTHGWYKIVVFPLSGEGAGKNEVDFIISYYQSWTDQYIHLYINGEYENIKWPQSGNNPKLIKIRHVAQETNVAD